VVTVDEPHGVQTKSFSEQVGGSPTVTAATSGQTLPKDSCTAFVSNLDYAITADQIREIFCKVNY